MTEGCLRPSLEKAFSRIPAHLKRAEKLSILRARAISIIFAFTNSIIFRFFSRQSILTRSSGRLWWEIPGGATMPLQDGKPVRTP